MRPEAARVCWPGSRWPAWTSPSRVPTPVAGKVGDFVYVVGGEDADGATDSIFRLELADREPAVDEAGRTLGWAVAQEQLLPAARSDAAGFVANGSIYVIGGVDETGQPQDSLYWVVPDAATGDLGAWQRLEQTDLPVALANAPLAGVASTAFIFGGVTPEGPADGLLRAGLSPAAAVLSAGALRSDAAGPVHQGRGRPAARLHQRHGRGHDQLRHPRPHRPGVLAPGGHAPAHLPACPVDA